MRIGFTGTGGTGKTTTLDLISADLGLPILRSPTRRVFERWGIGFDEAAQETMTPDDRLRLQMDIFSERMSEESSEVFMNGFISDRTLLDHYAYCIHRCYLSLDDASLSSLRESVRKNLLDYDMIFYFPVVFVPPNDGMRQQGEAYRSIIDSLIHSSFRDVPLIEVLMGTPEERAEFVSDIIREIHTPSPWSTLGDMAKGALGEVG